MLSLQSTYWHSRMPVLLGQELLHMSSAPVFTSGALVSVVATQETSLDHLALVATGAHISGFHRTVTIEERNLGRLPPTGHCTDRRLKHTLGLSVKEVFTCPGALV